MNEERKQQLHDVLKHVINNQETEAAAALKSILTDKAREILNRPASEKPAEAKTE